MNAKPQRICIVRHSYYPGCTRIYKQARALTEAGYAVDVVCLRGSESKNRETIDGVRVYRVLSAHRRGSVARYVFEYLLSLLIMGATLSVLFIKNRYRCVQVNTLPDSLVFAALLPRLCGARILLDLHEPTPELLLTKYDGKVSRRALRLHVLLEKLAIRFAHQAITVNETIRDRFAERGADPDKIGVVRNVPPEDFAADVPQRRPHEGLVVMTHGTIQPRYGQNLLLQALPAVRQAVGPLRVVVAGDGEIVDELKELARKLACDDIVTFTGMVSRKRIAELISQADIGVVPLLPGPFSDLCQPNKLFEYVAMQVPAVVARLPAIEETFDDSCLQYFRAGDVEDLTQALIKLANDAARRKTLATNALARFEPINWAHAKKEYVRIMDSLVKRDRPDSVPTTGTSIPVDANKSGHPAVGRSLKVRRLPELAVTVAVGAIAGAVIASLPPTGSLLVPAGILVAVLCYLSPYVALCLFFCGLVMTSDAVSLASKHAFIIPDMDLGGGLPPAMTSFLLLLFFVTMGRRLFLERRPLPIRMTGLAVYMAIVGAAFMTGLMKHNDRGLLRVDLMNMFFPILCFYLCITLLDSRERITRLLLILMAVTVVKAVVLNAYFLAGKGWAYGLDEQGRGNIVTLDSADLLYCITFILIAVHLIMRRDIRGIRAGLVIIACIPMLFAVLFSYRRAQWIGLIWSLGLLFLGAARSTRRRMALACTMLLCAGLFYAITVGVSAKAANSNVDMRIRSLFDKKQSSNRHHVLESLRVLHDLSHSPVLGLGLGSRHSGFASEEFKTIPTNIVHETFLYIWMKTGLPGLLFFIWLAVLYGKSILRIRRTHIRDPAWGLILPLAASFGLWLAMFLTSPIPWYMHQTFFKALVAAIVMSLILQAEREPQAQPENLP